MNKSVIRKRKIFGYLTLIMFCVIAIAGTVLRCAGLVQNNYLEQLQQNLADVADRNAYSLERQIELRHDILKSVAKVFEEKSDSERLEMVDSLTGFAEDFRLKRVGYVDAEGYSHGTQGGIVLLREREFYRQGMKGLCSISDTLSDAMDENHENVTVMSMPVHGPNKMVNGVACITYRTKAMSDELSMDCFEGKGSTFILNKKGTVLITSNKEILDISENLVDILFNENLGKYESKLQVADEYFILKDGNGFNQGTLRFKEQNFYYHVSHVWLMDDSTEWLVLSMVPTNYLQSRFYSTKRHLYRMVVFVIVHCIVLVLTIQYVSHSQNKHAIQLAFYSPVTKDVNLGRLMYVLKHNKIDNGYFVIMNIENYKYTRVAIGRSKSNDLLVSIWNKIKTDERRNEIFCHDKNDTFVMYMEPSKPKEIVSRVEKLRQDIYEAGIENNISWINPKFGISHIRKDETLEDASRRAEAALVDIMGTSDFYGFYQEENKKKHIEMQKLEEHFDAALKNREFQIWFQPKYSVKTKKLTGCEALVRWNFKHEHLISPADFIPMFEKTGKIQKLDEYIFNRVCEYQSSWKNEGLDIVPISVNLSKATLYTDNIVSKYCQVIESQGLDFKDIQIEVTETLVANVDNIASLLNAFRSKGIKILMDDFGTGYTALSVLNLQCFDTLKMDKSLVDGIDNAYGRTLLESVLKMVTDLGFYVTAEGVEKKEQLMFLEHTTCDDIQGFIFSKPIKSEEFRSLLQM